MKVVCLVSKDVAATDVFAVNKEQSFSEKQRSEQSNDLDKEKWIELFKHRERLMNLSMAHNYTCFLYGHA